MYFELKVPFKTGTNTNPEISKYLYLYIQDNIIGKIIMPNRFNKLASGKYKHPLEKTNSRFIKEFKTFDQHLNDNEICYQW